MKIIELEILTDDLEATARFYNGTLGFPFLGSTPQTRVFSIGDSILTFRKSENQHPVYHFAFNIPHDKLYESLEWISQKVDPLFLPEGGHVADFSSWNANAFYFKDNNGNILEFIARYDIALKENKPFDDQSILSISEIGIVVKDPLSFANDLVVNQNLNYFVKSKAAEEFVVLGNNDGLFIIVSHQRPWYPTSTPAISFPIKVTVMQNELIKTFQF
ncbi:MAG: glyoxalase [Saprospiraceae bacterium]|nr:glyoxalase [Saprospiraceae bacterium]